MTDHSRLPLLSGVFPVLPTPFDASGQPDLAGLRTLVRYLLRAGVDGITYPGVASEVAELGFEERVALTKVVLAEVAGRVPVIVGASTADAATTLRLVAELADAPISALMVAAPARVAPADQAGFFQQIAAGTAGLPLMLQNVPAPAGAGLAPELVLQIAKAVPQVHYIKEETLPSGQRLSLVLAAAPASLRGVFGGAGGRYITDELRRGACGTMPAIELAEVHVALFEAQRRGDARAVRRLFTRMLPILNIQAVFRWSLTKYVLQRRGLIAFRHQRAAGPLLDAQDSADVDAFLEDIRDLLLPDNELA